MAKLLIETNRSDLHHANPFDLIVKDELRGRQFAPSDADIVALAHSMLTMKQQQAIQCRKVDGKPLVVSGFTRTAAGRLIRDGFTFDGVHYQDENFRIAFKLVDSNDEEAFKRNVVENAIRNATSPIDDAHNQSKLRDNYGMSDVAIGQLYGYSNSVKVGRLRQLLALESNEQYLVHTGVLGVQAAIDLLSLPLDERRKIVADLEAGIKVTGAEIVKQVRDHHLKDDSEGAEGSESTEPTVKKSLSIREIRKFLEAELESDNHELLNNFYGVFLKFVNGAKGARSVQNAAKKLVATLPVKGGDGDADGEIFDDSKVA